MLGSTQTVGARNNTCTTGNGTGIRIHWLNGNKVEDNYRDLYMARWAGATSPTDESGNSSSATQVWTGSGNSGSPHALHLGSSVAVALGYLNGSNSPFQAGSASRGNLNPLYGMSQVFRVPTASQGTRATDLSIVSSPALGDTYRLGEAIEFGVTFSEAVDVRGTPQLALVMRDASDDAASEFRAGYVRGAGTTQLVFAYTVAAGDRAAGGIATGAAPLQLNGAMITAVDDGFEAISALTASSYIQSAGSRSKVDYSVVLSGGVCERTLQVRSAIVAAVTEDDSNVTNCSQVTQAHLAAVTGTLRVEGLTSIAAGDFVGLSGITTLALDGSGIATLPAGLFDGLDSLVNLLIVNVGLTHLPKDYFRGLGGLTQLRLDGNRLAAGGLPDGIFEPLTRAEYQHSTSTTTRAPESFRTTADAGPGGMLSAGQTVTLGGPGTAGGPWGSNVIYSWAQTDGDDMSASTVTLSAADVAKPGFTVPALASTTEVKLKLTVVGRGDDLVNLKYVGRSTAQFTIRALAVTGLAVVSSPLAGDGTYKQGEKIELAVTFGDRVLVDTSLGTPTLGFGVASSNANRQATYVRGSGTNRLVFEYTVQRTDRDSNGIEFPANALALNGGAITSIYGVEALLTYLPTAAQTGHKVDGTNDALSGGICDRTPPGARQAGGAGRGEPRRRHELLSGGPGSPHLPELTGTLALDADPFVSGVTA